MRLNVRTLLIVVAITAATTWWLTGSRDDDRRPLPHERPALRFVVKWAKSLLWLAAFADPPPAEAPPPIQQQVGDDGYPALAHARSL